MIFLSQTWTEMFHKPYPSQKKTPKDQMNCPSEYNVFGSKLGRLE